MRRGGGAFLGGVVRFRMLEGVDGGGHRKAAKELLVNRVHYLGFFG